MAEGIDISHGGVIAVDTEVLRGVLPNFAVTSRHLLDCSARLRSGAGALDAAAYQPGAVASSEVMFGLGHRMRRHADAVEATATAVDATQAKVLLMVEAYEIVELRARLELLELQDARTVDVFRSELASRERENAAASELADGLIAAWEDRRSQGLGDSASAMAAFGRLTPLAWLPAAVGHARTVIGRSANALRTGIHPRGAPVPPRWSPEVDVTTRSVGTVKPPASLTDAFQRIPDGDAQVRVEKYTMADGSDQFVVYVAGTREFGGPDPWNMPSNDKL